MKYKYVAKDSEGHVLRNKISAESPEQLREMLFDRELFLLSCKKIPEPIVLVSRVKTPELTNFCNELSIMLSSGISLIKSLVMLSNSIRNPFLKTIAVKLHVELLKGRTLSDAMGDYKKVFPVFFINMIRIGELTGRLDLVFNKLSIFYEKNDKIQKKIRSTMAYPIFLFSLTIVVFFVLIFFVMPIFANVFASFGSDLPPITQKTLDFVAFAQKYGLYFVLGVLVLVLIFLFWKRSKKGKLLWDEFKIKFPITKKLNQSVLTIRFTYGFSTLLSSGLKIINATEQIGDLLGNEYVKQRFQIVNNSIKKGASIAKSLEIIGTFPNILIEMIEIGEETNSVEKVLLIINDYYEEQVKNDSAKLISMIEPAVIMILALVVVFVLLSVFIPMMDLMQAIEGSGV
jgi:type IV pilus assembly protein PilC